MCDPRRWSIGDIGQSEGGMNPVKHTALLMCALALLLLGCGKQQEAAKVPVGSTAAAEAHMLPPRDIAVRADSLIHANHVVTYRNSKYGFSLRYDSSFVRVNAWATGEEVGFLRDQTLFAQLWVMHEGHLSGYIRRDSLWIENLRETTMLPDTPYAAAVLRMMDGCAAGGPDADGGLEMPLTEVSRDTTPHGVHYLKIWCDYVVRWNDKAPDHYPVGPFYLVDVSTPGKRTFLEARYDCSRRTPTNVERFLDSLVNTIEIVR